MLHTLLIALKAKISLIWMSLNFLWFLNSLQRGNFRYQFKQFGFALIGSLFISYMWVCFI